MPRALDAVAQRFVSTDSADSLSGRMRQRRWERLAAEFPDIADMRVLDIAGRPSTGAIGTSIPRR